MENNKKWYSILSSLNDIKRDGFITDAEYDDFKEKLRANLSNESTKSLKTTDYSSYENCISEDDIYDFIESFSGLDEKSITSFLKKSKRIDLYHILDAYNWDDGFYLPSLILKHQDCDLALAMYIFILAEGNLAVAQCYIDKKQPDKYELEWWNFGVNLFNDMGAGKFKIDDQYIELSAGLKIILYKNGVVNLLNEDIGFLFDK